MRPPRASGSGDDRSEERAGREIEGATFETARVGGRRRQPPVFVLAFVALVGGMVAIGVAGRTPAAAPAVFGSPVALESMPVTSGQTTFPEGPPIGPGSSLFSPDVAPIVTNGSGPIVIQARRHPETMYIHGDVFVADVTWVFVSLQDQGGRIAGWASVSVPGAAGPGVDDGPTLRFDVELALTAESSAGSLTIHVSAHNATGQLVATAQLEIDRDGDRVVAERRPPYRAGVFFPLLDATWADVR